MGLDGCQKWGWRLEKGCVCRKNGVGSSDMMGLDCCQRYGWMVSNFGFGCRATNPVHFGPDKDLANKNKNRIQIIP